jgi:cell wall-associated protease
MKSIYCTAALVLLVMSCTALKKSDTKIVKATLKEPGTDPAQYWYHQDLDVDSIPGTSLDKWYNENTKTPMGKSIIVAVIDTQLDLEHEDFAGQIWTNKNEIPNNNIDDDANGYTDDIHGWSFLGTKNGPVQWGNFEYTRVVKKGNEAFKNKTETDIPAKEVQAYKEYKRALAIHDKNTAYYKNWLKSMDYGVAVYPQAKDALKKFFPKEDYTYEQLDSLYKIHKSNDKTYRQRRDDNDRDLGALIYNMMLNVESKAGLNELKAEQAYVDSTLNKLLNIAYDDRKLIGDNPEVLEKGYGNNKVSSTVNSKVSIEGHSSKVSGVIAANRINNKGIKGFSQNIKIMPLHICTNADEHDKDIALAIRYAVDNGAKVINMSFGKEFSLHKEWVDEALKYAESKEVLVIHAAGNNGFNSDEKPLYPSDYSYDGLPEVCTNFISVGSISKRIDSTLVSRFSNYGKQTVDLFAPGDEIYTTEAGNVYGYDSGTSLAAPMVSGAAALIWSHYPKLTMKEVKQIILDSGTAYHMEVIVPGTKDKKVPFSELSKTGRALNVYNAMKMAEKLNR